MKPQRSPLASPQDIEFLSKVAAYWKSKEPQPDATTQFGRFVVKETLGQGGFGIVYRAIDPLLGRDVAIKVPGLQSLSDESRLKRFLGEARHLGSLSHPNIAEIYEANEVDGLCYIAMKYYPDGTLADWLKTQKYPIPSHLIARIFEGIVAGVAAAHSVGIVHRDLKPSNILVATNASEIVPCVADFGLAKSPTADDQSYSLANFALIGTTEYMAPEKFTDQPGAIPTGDVFALGVILFELLVGRKPVLYRSVASSVGQPSVPVLVSEIAMEQQLQTEIQNLRSTLPDAPLALVRIVANCLKFSSSERYADANAILEALQSAPTAIPTRRFRVGREIKRFTLGVAAIAVAAAAIWGVINYRPLQNITSPPPVLKAKENQSESRYSYALAIQSVFARSKSDSSHVRRQAVRRALSFLPTQIVPFESAYLYYLGDSNREFALNLGQTHWIPSAKISKDGKWLGVKGPMQDLLLFDLAYPQTVRRYQGMPGGVFRMAISPNNKYVVGIDSIYRRPDRVAPQVLLWDFESSKLLLDLNVHLGLINPNTCEFASDDQLLLSGAYRDGNHVKLFSIVDRVVEQSFPIAPLTSEQELVDENLRFQVTETVRTTTQTPKITVVDKMDECKSSFELKHDAVASAISTSGLIAIVDSPSDSSNVELAQNALIEHQIIVWNPKTQSELFRESRMDSNPISAIAFSPDEESIFFIDMQGIVRQRSLEPFSLERSIDGLPLNEKWSVSAHPSEPKLLYCGDGGWVGLHESHNPEATQRSNQQARLSQWTLHGDMLVTQCAWRPGHKDQFATSSFDGTVRLWRLTNDVPEKLAEFLHPGSVRCIAFTADGAQIATGCDDQQIRIFDMDSRNLISTLAEHKGKLRSLVYSQDARTLFSSANDSTLVTWDLKNAGHRKIEHLTANSICSVISPNGKWLVFGTEAGMLGIRSVAVDGESKDIPVSKKWLRSLALTSDSQTLATGTHEGEIALWNLETGIKLAEFSKQSSPIMSLSFSADNRILAAALYSGQLVVWKAFTDLPEDDPRNLKP